MPERIPEILKTLETLGGQVGGLITEIEGLREEVHVSEEVAEKADKASRRAWHLTWFDLFLTVVAFVLGGFLTVAIIHSNDAQQKSNRNALTQYESCIQGNQARHDIANAFSQLLVQAKATVVAQKPTIRPDQIDAYNRTIAFYDAQIALTQHEFGPHTCVKPK